MSDAKSIGSLTFFVNFVCFLRPEGFEAGEVEAFVHKNKHDDHWPSPTGEVGMLRKASRRPLSDFIPLRCGKIRCP